MNDTKETKTGLKGWKKWLCIGLACAAVAGVGVGLAFGLSSIKKPAQESSGVMTTETPTEAEEPIPVFIEPEEEPPEVVIQTYYVIGDWKNSRVSGDGSESGEYGPFRSQDRDTFTMWNPEAWPGYEGEPGIIYMFDKEYDLRRIVLTLSSKVNYFTVSVSTDGENYTLVADLDHTNAEKAYQKNVCTFDGLDLKQVKYVKIIFTGSSTNNTFISFREAEFFYTGAEPGDTSWMIAKRPDNAKIVKGTAIGSWRRSNVDHTSNGMTKSYDNNLDTMWNPLADTFAGNPGVVYELDRAYDLKRFELTFSGSIHYFELFVSKDGSAYRKIAAIASTNAKRAYIDSVEGHYTAQLDGFDLKDIRFVKILFTGRPSGTLWVGLQEAWFFETGRDPGDTSWMLADGEAGLSISKAEAIGSWKNENLTGTTINLGFSYDGRLATRWNPEANGAFAGDPGVVYTLRNAADVKRVSLYFSYGVHYYDLYVSSDGEKWIPTAFISPDNADKTYSTQGDMNVSTLDGLSAKNVKYIKVIFTGRAGTDSGWVSLHEVKVFDSEKNGLDNSWMLPERSKVISSAEITGAWHSDSLTGATTGLANSYDGKVATRWNPEAEAGFAGDPGVVFTLEEPTAVKRIVLTFSYGSHYYDLFVSDDGEHWIQVAGITEDNADKAYAGGDASGDEQKAAVDDHSISTLDGLSLEKVKYIKILFTGRAGTSSAWVSLHEIEVFDTGSEGIDTSWMIPVKEEKTGIYIIDAAVTGNWHSENLTGATISLANSYDGKISTRWNPEAEAGFAGDPGVVFTLNEPAVIKKIALTFSYGRHYYDLFVSGDGENWTRVAGISEENADKAYSAAKESEAPAGSEGKTEPDEQSVSILDGLSLENVKYIKVLFTGRAGTTSAWVSLHEAEVFDTGSEGIDTSWMLPVNEEKTGPVIIDAAVTGSWHNENLTGATISLANSYDGKIGTRWNPEAEAGFAGDPGVIFTLEDPAAIKKAVLSFSYGRHYFDLFVSEDGESWIQLARINDKNADLAYEATQEGGENKTGVEDRATCVLDGLTAENVKYIKLVFIGRAGTSSAWVSLHEVEVFDEGSECLDISWMLPESDSGMEPGTDPAGPVIKANTLTGEWRMPRTGDTSIGPEKTYDGDASTKWNPCAKGGYAGDCGIIYTLDNYYLLSEVKLTFAASDVYYLILSGSSDGTRFTELGSVTAQTAADHYSETECSFAISGDTAVKYLRIIFTGRAIDNDYVSLYEVSLAGTATEAPAGSTDSDISIAAHELLGDWPAAGGTNRTADKSYDNNAETSWNASIKKNVSSVIYTLDAVYSISGMVTTWDRATTWFDVYTSSDGASWTAAASVTAESGNYDGNTCTLSNLSASAAKYVKIVFTGNTSSWFALYEISLTGVAADQ